MRHYMQSSMLVFGAAILATIGCEQKPPPPPGPTPAETAKMQQPATQDAELAGDEQAALTNMLSEQSGGRAATPAMPPGHPPMGDKAPANRPMPKLGPDGLPAGHPAVADGVTLGGVRPTRVSFTAPDGWEQTEPSSSMRKAQYTLPGEAGAGELVLFYFGRNQGGDVASNLARWRGQMMSPEGGAVGDDAVETEQFEANGMKVHVLKVNGTLAPSTMGMGPKEPQPDQRMLAAVVETPEGNYFIKATGPEATMRAQEEAFYAYVRSVNAKEPS